MWALVVRPPSAETATAPKESGLTARVVFAAPSQLRGSGAFRDFREDQVLDIRQFQMAFRRLRQYSSGDNVPESEFSLEKTVQATCRNAGRLTVSYQKPRRNTIKLLLLMDSGGSMYHYSKLCSGLFQAANQANHFKDLRIYYFHNCVYDRLYTDPRIQPRDSVATDWTLKQFGPEYRVAFVGMPK